MSLAENIRAVNTMLGLARHTRKPGLKAAALQAAGVHLERLRHGRTKLEWSDIVRVNCGISDRRAYELIKLGKRQMSLIEHRAATAARGRKHYRAKSKGRGEIPHVESASNVQLGHKKTEQHQ